MQSVGRAEETVFRNQAKAPPNTQVSICRNGLPGISALSAVLFILGQEISKMLGGYTALAVGPMQSCGNFNLRMSCRGNIVCRAQIAHLRPSGIFKINADEITRVAEYHAVLSARISSRISSMDLSPGFGRKAPLSISFLNPGSNLRREK